MISIWVDEDKNRLMSMPINYTSQDSKHIVK